MLQMNLLQEIRQWLRKAHHYYAHLSRHGLVLQIMLVLL
jgi:hypothetical protein